MGVYRLWRDSGYAFGALMTGVLADVWNLTWSIGLVAIFSFTRRDGGCSSDERDIEKIERKISNTGEKIFTT